MGQKAAPNTAVQTPRLNLRPPAAADAADILRIRADAEYTRLTGISYQTLAQAETYLQRIAQQILANEVRFWMLTAREDGRVLGSICLWNLKWEKTQGEIGYDLLPESRGKGYMAEAVEGVLGYAFGALGLKTVVAQGLHPDNKKSMAVLARAGFRPAQKELCYSITKEEYENRKNNG
jgi:Acetyltransferases, including N-acetylases of ribosomal proteins